MPGDADRQGRELDRGILERRERHSRVHAGTEKVVDRRAGGAHGQSDRRTIDQHRQLCRTDLALGRAEGLVQTAQQVLMALTGDRPEGTPHSRAALQRYGRAAHNCATAAAGPVPQRQELLLYELEALLGFDSHAPGIGMALEGIPQSNLAPQLTKRLEPAASSGAPCLRVGVEAREAEGVQRGLRRRPSRRSCLQTRHTYYPTIF